MKKTTCILQAITIISGILFFTACTKQIAHPIKDLNAAQERISVLETSQLTKTKPINYIGIGILDSTAATK